MNNTITIRQERENEYRQVENLVRESFWNVYRPGCMEHYVIHQLRRDPEFVPELDLVMFQGEELIGQSLSMKAKIIADDEQDVPVLTLGPICIAPKFERQGFGKILLDYSLEQAKKFGYGAVFLEGNIEFYGKSGFQQASVFGIRYQGLPAEEDAPFFLCKELTPGFLQDITGEYVTPAGYFVDEQETEAFDKEFPPKEKKILPGQLFS